MQCIDALPGSLAAKAEDNHAKYSLPQSLSLGSNSVPWYMY